MQYKLKEARQSIGISAKDIAKAAGIVEPFYRKYEKKECIPCKYVYKIWLKYPKYPLPKDFFWYTSFTLKCNLDYHKITQAQAARMLGISSQSTISRYLASDIPMYDYKDKFNKAFVPLVVPMEVKECNSREGPVQTLKYIVNLEIQGNPKNHTPENRG